jgi:hypothetical protein
MASLPWQQKKQMTQTQPNPLSPTKPQVPNAAARIYKAKVGAFNVQPLRDGRGRLVIDELKYVSESYNDYKRVPELFIARVRIQTWEPVTVPEDMLRVGEAPPVPHKPGDLVKFSKNLDTAPNLDTVKSFLFSAMNVTDEEVDQTEFEKAWAGVEGEMPSFFDDPSPLRGRVVEYATQRRKSREQENIYTRWTFQAVELTEEEVAANCRWLDGK